MLTRGWEEFDSRDVKFTANIIGGIIQTDVSMTSEKVVTNTLESVNNLLNIEQGVVTKAQDEEGTSKR